MFYCEKCHFLSDNTSCRNCGVDNLREVKDDDFCYLATIDEFFGKMLIDAMVNEDIKYLVIPVGNGVRSHVALSLGNYQLYVTYNQYRFASEIIEFYTQNYSLDKLREKILNNLSKWHFENNKVEKKIRKKLKVAQEIDLIEYIKEKVEKAESISDVGLMTCGEHGLMVKSENIVLWFSSESFEINI